MIMIMINNHENKYVITAITSNNSDANEQG